ncbi:MAG TPA: 50S ribosomal protein L24 [Candidatus Sulfotelmatobacter sp.]|nr:50S ribosomal protein L24 [Candidatus Sulfotelmatobacter sp.]
MTLRHERVKRHRIQIRKGDQVHVIAGPDAGKNGRVLSIDSRKDRVVVEHVHIVKRHTRPNPQKNIKGGIVEKEAAIHVSNVMILCPSCGKHTRIGHKIHPDGTKSRICKRCDATLDK